MDWNRLEDAVFGVFMPMVFPTLSGAFPIINAEESMDDWVQIMPDHGGLVPDGIGAEGIAVEKKTGQDSGGHQRAKHRGLSLTGRLGRASGQRPIRDPGGVGFSGV